MSGAHKRLAALLSALLCAMSMYSTSHAQEAAPSPASAPRITVIHAGTLLAEPGQKVLREQTIVITNDIITSVEPGYRPASTVNGEARLIDLKNGFVLPGLMDLHKHIAMPLDAPPEFLASEGKLALLTAAVARGVLAAGVTTVRDIGDNTGVTFTVRDAINAGFVDGPRVIAAGRIISRTGGHGAARPRPGELDYTAGGCDGPESCRRVVRENIEAGSDWIKVTVSGSGGEATGQRPAEPIMLPEEVSAVMSAARLAKRPVAAHAQSTAAINLSLELGARTIEHGVYFDGKSVSLFKANDAYLVPTAYVAEFVNQQLDKFSAMPGRLDAKGLKQWTVDAMANPGRAYRAGIRLGVGSDSGSLVDAHATARELELYVAQGIPAAEALKSATVINAEILGLADRVGRIRSGFEADLIALKGDPLADISQLRKVIFVMRGGAVKVEPPAEGGRVPRAAETGHEGR